MVRPLSDRSDKASPTVDLTVIPSTIAWPGPDTHLSAFSNTSGGTVIIGLDEMSGFAPAEGFDARSVLDQLSEAGRPRGTSDTPGPVTPTPAMTIDQVEVDGAMVVVADIDELPAAEKPCFVTAQGKERGTYVRLADGDHRLDTYSVFQLSVLTVPSEADREPVHGTTIADLDAVLVARTIARLRTNRPRALDGTTSDKKVLERIGVIDRASDTPTLGAILALGTFPQQFFPQLMISFVAYPGNSKDVVTGDERMVDRAVLEGSIPDMIDDAVAATIRNLRVRRVSRGAGAQDVPEIPVDAIREAIANALALIHHAGSVTVDELRRQLGIDTTEAQDALDRLVASSLVMKERSTYRLAEGAGQRQLSATELAVIDALAGGTTLTVQALADAIGRSPATLRPILRKMINRGLIVATAPPTSRKRAYRLADT